MKETSFGPLIVRNLLDAVVHDLWVVRTSVHKREANKKRPKYQGATKYPNSVSTKYRSELHKMIIIVRSDRAQAVQPSKLCLFLLRKYKELKGTD